MELPLAWRTSLALAPGASAYLDDVVIEMLRVAVDQIDLLGVRVIHLLLIHLVGHGLIVGLVDVALFPDGNRVEMSLRRGQAFRRGRWQQKKKKKSKRKRKRERKRSKGSLAIANTWS